MNAKRCILGSVWAALVLGGWLTWRENQGSPIIRDPDQSGTNAKKAATSTSSVIENWRQRWREAGTIVDETQRAQTKESLIEALARNDPLCAVEVARSESNEELRSRLIEAAMRIWGQTDPEAALASLAAESHIASGPAIAAIFHGAANDPERAIQLANNLSRSDPSRATNHGLYLVAALARAGAFSKAADFAATSTSESRSIWINDAYSRWATHSPEQALAHATQLSDPKTRKTASSAVLLRWAYTDAPAAARHALTLPDSEQRRFAFSKAIPLWVAAQPVEAAVWMSNVEPSAELDLVAASIATRSGVSQNPEVSALWAENILEPALRVQVMASVIHKWAETDSAAARRYAETSSSIRPEERAEVLAALKPGFDPISFAP